MKAAKGCITGAIVGALLGLGVIILPTLSGPVNWDQATGIVMLIPVGAIFGAFVGLVIAALKS